MTIKSDQSRPLQKMFMSVPPSYDLLNRLLTFRFDERWRMKAANKILEFKPERILDLCTGTGDLAIRMRRFVPAGSMIWALDYSEPMLELARRKATRAGMVVGDFDDRMESHSQMPDTIFFVRGDAANMPFDDGFFDAIGIAFAFRNLTFSNPDAQRFMKEIRRVLKPGGRFVVVETSQPTNRFLRRMTHAYLKHVTVPFGGLISGNRGAYHYLAHSAINYYNATEVRQLMLDSGFTTVWHEPLLSGVAALYTAD